MSVQGAGGQQGSALDQTTAETRADAETEPIVAQRVPETFRERIRLRLPGAQREMFDELMAWEDSIVEALNLATAAADRMAEGLNACASAAGNPDAAEGCRQVIALARRALCGADQEAGHRG